MEVYDEKNDFTLPSVHSCPFDSVLEWQQQKRNFKIDPARSGSQ
nr:hypothetical protein [Dubosiella newyorkensis]